LKAREGKDCLYINFEDIEMEGTTYKDLYGLVGLYEETFGHRPKVLLFDEVQKVVGWEKAINQLYESKRYEIYLSGSSSRMLAKEIATALRGRGTKHVMLPLSFREFLDFKEWKTQTRYSTSQENQIKNLLMRYLERGGFPLIACDERSFAKFFEEYVDLVIYRDMVERHGIKNIFILKYLIRSLMSSCSKEFSINKVHNTLRSQGIKTSNRLLYEYFSFLEDAFFVFGLRKYSHSLKHTELSIPKIYLADTGIVTYSNGFEVGKAMENTVFLELLRRKYAEPPLDIFYWKDNSGECDFVLRKNGKTLSLIQVSYISKGPVSEKEVQGLLRCASELRCDDLLLITWDIEGVINGTIKMIPLWKWLMNKS